MEPARDCEGKGASQALEVWRYSVWSEHWAENRERSEGRYQDVQLVHDYFIAGCSDRRIIIMDTWEKREMKNTSL